MPARSAEDVDYGLKILVTGQGDPAVDVIAIHGTGAHPDDTWSQLRAANLPVADAKSYINWLQDKTMLPNVLQGARIMRFGYESAWFGNQMISTSPSQISRALLRELDLVRVDQPRRPLIVIAHSFGGLVTMRMIKDAAAEYTDIYVSIVGLVFLGTPFRGSGDLPQRTLLRLAHEHNERVDESQLRDSGGDSTYLKDLLDDFLMTLRLIPKPRVLCVYEMKQTNVTVVVNKHQDQETNYCLWVTETSATLDLTDKMIDKQSRQCDHLRLNKFRHPELSEFKLLAKALRRMAEQGPDLVQTRRRAIREVWDAQSARQMSARQPTEQPPGLTPPQGLPTRPVTPIPPPSPQPAPVKTPEPMSSADTDVPWEDLRWFDGQLGVRSRSSRLSLWTHAPRTLSTLLQRDASYELYDFAAKIYFRLKPFDVEKNYTSHYARVAKSSMRYTLKLARNATVSGESVMESARISHLTRSLVMAFNDRLPDVILDIRAPSCFKNTTTNSTRWLLLQPWLGDGLTAYDNAIEAASSTTANTALLCRAFSHFTFELSKGELLVDGLRGKGRMLTTPTVHTKDRTRFSLSEDRGVEAMHAFFRSHACNEYCRRLKLLSSSEMFKTDVWKFQTAWPPLDCVWTCSNKLCRRLFRQASLSKAVAGADLRFCDVCAPCWALCKRQQTCRVCHGEVQVFSEFYYTSQGLPMPDLCARHAES